MTDKLHLIVSEKFNYKQTIVPDCGYEYAKALGISSVPISKADFSSSGIWILDNRIEETENALLLPLLAKHKKTKILIRVIDPYWETADATPHLHFAFKASRLPNVGFLSPYQPEEVVKFLFDNALQTGGFFVSPYPYEKESELEIEATWEKRSKKIALSGRRNANVYPYRESMYRKQWADLKMWGKFRILNHPGYPDLNNALLHKKVGRSFVEWLSKSEICYLCPSRCHLEFLKYRECAYAGCCPAGVPPKTMDTHPKDIFLRLELSDYHYNRDFVLKQSKQERMERALAFRQAMQRERDPKRLREKLLTELSAWKS